MRMRGDTRETVILPGKARTAVSAANALHLDIFHTHAFAHVGHASRHSSDDGRDHDRKR